MKVFLGFILLLLHQNVDGLREGDSCIDDYTGIQGVCRKALECTQAKIDYQRNGIKPTFCYRAKFRDSLICCKDGNSILQTTASTSRPSWSNSNDRQRISQRKCQEYSKDVTAVFSSMTLAAEPEVNEASVPKCNYASVELIVGGEAASLNEFPHMAAIGWVNDYNEYEFLCGGSLISNRFVLTAAHCTFRARSRNPRPAIVRLGDHNIDPNVEDNTITVDVPIRNIIRHPNYKSPVTYNDIALLELASDVELSHRVRPACLWQQDGFNGIQKAIATGWGVVNKTSQETAKELQKVSLTLLENAYCDRLLLNKRGSKWGGFAASQLCAGELKGGADTCQGDSGGPIQLVSKSNQCIFNLIGVTSFGAQCAVSGRPAIYTRISSYIDWIESIVWPDN